MGGVGAVGDARRHRRRSTTSSRSTCSGKTFGLFGTEGLLPERRHLRRRRLGDVPVPDGVHGHGRARFRTGAMAERWKFSAFIVFGVLHGRCSSTRCSRNWVWGGGWLAQLGTQLRPRPRPRRLRRLVGRAHGRRRRRAGRRRSSSGRASASTTRTATPNADPGPRHPDGARSARFILAFGWFGFNPGSTLGRRRPAHRASSRSTRCSPARPARSRRCSTCGCATASPIPSMLATACWPAWWRSPRPAPSSTACRPCIIGVIAGVLVVVSVFFVERMLKIDDPVGAISVHGVNGAWGVLSRRPVRRRQPTATAGTACPARSRACSTATHRSSSRSASATLTCFVFVFVSFYRVLQARRSDSWATRLGRGRARRARHARDGRARLSRLRARTWNADTHGMSIAAAAKPQAAHAGALKPVRVE